MAHGSGAAHANYPYDFLWGHSEEYDVYEIIHWGNGDPYEGLYARGKDNWTAKWCAEERAWFEGRYVPGSDVSEPTSYSSTFNDLYEVFPDLTGVSDYLTICNPDYRYTGIGSIDYMMGRTSQVFQYTSRDASYTIDEFVAKFREYYREVAGSYPDTSYEVTKLEHDINCDDLDHGGLWTTPESAKERETIEITINPNRGYAISSVSVTDPEGNSVPVSGSGGRRTFVMPDAEVDLKVTLTYVGEPADFPDVHEGDWFYDAVSWVSQNGIMNGQGDGSFDPAGSLSRAAMAQLLYNMEGNPSVNKNVVGRFSDCDANDWYASAVAWAYQAGAITGYDSTSFGPLDTVTREQFATIIWRLEGEPSGSGNLAVFPDAASTSGFAEEAMRWAVGKGLIAGDRGRLNPTGSINRAMAAQIIMR